MKRALATIVVDYAQSTIAAPEKRILGQMLLRTKLARPEMYSVEDFRLFVYRAISVMLADEQQAEIHNREPCTTAA